MIFDVLIERVVKCKNHTVVGLDPRLEYVPGFIREEANTGEVAKDAARAFLCYNKQLIDYLYDIVPAVKPQIAFYEQYGPPGLECFMETCSYAKSKGMVVVGDVKRGDIGSTAEGYADFFLGDNAYSADTDIITVNPYLGTDSIAPFVKNCKKNGKGVFVLVKTSNKSSVDIQDLVSNGRRIYEHVAEIVVELGDGSRGRHGYSSVGAVVGATFKEDAARLRKLMKHNYFLVPGYGAQGGTAEDAAECFNENGLGALVNSSRGIIAAYKAPDYSSRFSENQFAEAAREAAIKMRDDINNELGRQKKLAW
ncbi:MAG: orotidine-5'-phosphate decarboxylase [Bacillota bacterium]